MSKDMIRPAAAASRAPIHGTPLALAVVALGVLLLLILVVLGLSSGPAEADALTFSVNKTGDASDRRITDEVCDVSRTRGKQCTLRAAIQEANATLGGTADVIRFKIGGTTGVKTIRPASPLPEITDPVTINGYTQRGASENTLVQGNDAVLKVQLNGAKAGSGTDGLMIRASNSTIKGLVINRFASDGVVILGSSATGNKVEGNFIGTNASGTTDRDASGNELGNGDDGVQVSSAPNNTIGGATSGARNVISGNQSNGVEIFGSSATGNKVEGNFVGTRASGSEALPNGSDGVSLNSADDNTIGGTTSIAGRNVISGNAGDGIQISGSGATGNKVQGNLIGTNATGNTDLGNGSDGVDVLGQADNTIAGNLIAHNSGNGVLIFSTATGNNILSNQIFSNGSLGIDLATDPTGRGVVTPNDPDDPDTGPNNLQNFPVIDSVTRNPTTGFRTISGRLNSNPSRSFTIQCFLAGARGDPSGNGEGVALLGTTTATTNSGGDATFTCPPTPLLQPGHTVSATATRLDTSTDPDTPIETSEFSENELVVQE